VKDREAAGGTRFTRRELLALVAVLLLAVVVRLPSLWEPIGTDQAISALFADALRDGQVFYRDIWDHHTPLEFWIHALAQTVLGSSQRTVYLLDLLWTLASAGAIYAVARRLYGRWTGLLGTGLYVLFSNSVAFNQHTFGTWTIRIKPESLTILPHALGIHALLRASERGGRRPVLWWGLAGVALGFAAGLKPSAAIFLVAAWLVALFVASQRSGDRLRAVVRSTLWLAGGAVLVQFLYLLPIAFQGTLREFYEAAVLYNFGPYLELGLSSTRFRIVSVLIGKETLGLWSLALVAFGLMLVRDRRLGNWLVVGWGVLNGALILIHDRHFSYHYVPLVPSLSLLAAYGAVQLWRWPRRWRVGLAKGILRATLVILLLANLVQWVSTNAGYISHFVFFASGRIDADTFYGRFYTYPKHYSYPADKAVADWVRERTEPDEPLGTLGGFGATPVYLAQRPPASRYVFTYHIFHTNIADHPTVRTMRAELLADLQTSQPPYILLFRPLEGFERFGPLYEWLTSNYELEREFMHGRVLLRRIGR